MESGQQSRVVATEARLFGSQISSQTGSYVCPSLASLLARVPPKLTAKADGLGLLHDLHVVQGREIAVFDLRGDLIAGLDGVVHNRLIR